MACNGSIGQGSDLLTALARLHSLIPSLESTNLECTRETLTLREICFFNVKSYTGITIKQDSCCLSLKQDLKVTGA